MGNVNSGQDKSKKTQATYGSNSSSSAATPGKAVSTFDSATQPLTPHTVTPAVRTPLSSFHMSPNISAASLPTPVMVGKYNVYFNQYLRENIYTQEADDGGNFHGGYTEIQLIKEIDFSPVHGIIHIGMTTCKSYAAHYALKQRLDSVLTAELDRLAKFLKISFDKNIIAIRHGNFCEFHDNHTSNIIITIELKKENFTKNDQGWRNIPRDYFRLVGLYDELIKLQENESFFFTNYHYPVTISDPKSIKRISKMFSQYKSDEPELASLITSKTGLNSQASYNSIDNELTITLNTSDPEYIEMYVKGYLSFLSHVTSKIDADKVVFTITFDHENSLTPAQNIGLITDALFNSPEADFSQRINTEKNARLAVLKTNSDLLKKSDLNQYLARSPITISQVEGPAAEYFAEVVDTSYQDNSRLSSSYRNPPSRTGNHSVDIGFSIIVNRSHSELDKNPLAPIVRLNNLRNTVVSQPLSTYVFKLAKTSTPAGGIAFSDSRYVSVTSLLSNFSKYAKNWDGEANLLKPPSLHPERCHVSAQVALIPDFDNEATEVVPKTFSRSGTELIIIIFPNGALAHKVVRSGIHSYHYIQEKVGNAISGRSMAVRLNRAKITAQDNLYEHRLQQHTLTQAQINAYANLNEDKSKVFVIQVPLEDPHAAPRVTVSHSEHYTIRSTRSVATRGGGIGEAQIESGQIMNKDIQTGRSTDLRRAKNSEILITVTDCLVFQKDVNPIQVARYCQKLLQAQYQLGQEALADVADELQYLADLRAKYAKHKKNTPQAAASSSASSAHVSGAIYRLSESAEQDERIEKLNDRITELGLRCPITLTFIQTPYTLQGSRANSPNVVLYEKEAVCRPGFEVIKCPLTRDAVKPVPTQNVYNERLAILQTEFSNLFAERLQQHALQQSVKFEIFEDLDAALKNILEPYRINYKTDNSIFVTALLRLAIPNAQPSLVLCERSQNPDTIRISLPLTSMEMTQFISHFANEAEVVASFDELSMFDFSLSNIGKLFPAIEKNMKNILENSPTSQNITGIFASAASRTSPLLFAPSSALPARDSHDDIRRGPVP
jgi:hypothetical protein